MNTYSKMFGHCLFVLLLCSVGGCASSDDSRNAKTRKAANLHAENQWDSRLESDDKAETSEPFEVNGRRMMVKSWKFNDKQVQPNGTVQQNRVTYYGQLRIENIHIRTAVALLDADTGQAIMPRDYARIVPIPGHGVYVMPGNELARHARSWVEHKKWSELDVTTGELKPSDILDVFAVPIGDKRRGSELKWKLQARAVGVLRVDPESTPATPLIQMEVFPAQVSGLQASTYTRVKRQNGYGHSFLVGRYVKLERVGTDGEISTVLLDDDGTFCLETDQTIGVFTHRRSNDKWNDVFTTLGIHAPGTDATDDLWLILDDSGRFGAPAGVLGFRPLHTYWTAKNGTGGRALGWLVRYAVEDENQVKWEALGSEFKPLNGHRRYIEAILFEAPWFYPPLNKYDKGDTRNRPFLAIKTPAGIWELHGGDNPPDLMDTRRRLILSGTNFEQLQSKLDTKLEKDHIAYAAYEKAKAEKERKDRIAALQRNFQNAIRNKSWTTAESLAGQLGDDSYYVLARAMPEPTILFLKRAIERTSSQTYKQYLKKMKDAEQIKYDQKLAQHQSWQQKQNSRRSFSSSGSSSYQPKAPPPKTMAQYMHEHAQAERYKDYSSYTQHSVNMGWYRPSGY